MYRITGQNRLGCSSRQAAPFLQKPLDMAKASDFTQHGDPMEFHEEIGI